jgi:hypothetical protein
MVKDLLSTPSPKKALNMAWQNATRYQPYGNAARNFIY